MARPRSYRISLSETERAFIKYTQKTTHSPGIRSRCAVLLAADEAVCSQGYTYAHIASISGVSEQTVITVLREFCSGSIPSTLTYKRSPRSDTARLKVDGTLEAKIIAMACGSPPEGYVRWTLTLLADKVTEILDQRLSRSTIGRVLSSNELRPHLNEYWCIPPHEDAEFVACMEDVLDLYCTPYDPKRPLWCMDEKPYQLLGEAADPLPSRPGCVRKTDSEYKRKGTASIFCFMQPHQGRIVTSTEPTRCAIDWAEKIKVLVDEIEPDAEKIVVVADNLNTHRISSLYKAFPPQEARRIASKLEIHYTPKHGSWLNIAEVGISIISKQCLNRRIPTIEELKSELHAWNQAYNENPTPVDWQFRTEDARVKLKHLYPDIGQLRRNHVKHQKEKSASKP